MTANPPPTDPVRRLTRSNDDRIIAGVCGGVARYFQIDPVIVRVVAVALIFVGGAGALLYLAALLLVPNEGVDGAPAPDRNRVFVVLGVIVLVVLAGPLIFGPALLFGGLLFPLAFLVIAALVTAWFVTGRWPEREAGPIARAIALGLGVLAVLAVVSLGAAWAAAEGGEEIIAGLVIAAGVALVVGAFFKPVRWLIPLALALALPAGFVQAAGIELDGGYGEKRYRPATAADVRDLYEIGAGELTIDLRDVDFPAGEREIDVEVGLGEAIVLVPRDVCVTTRAELGAGEVDRFGVENGGVDIDIEDELSGPAGTPRLIVDAEIGLGALRVAHQPRDWHDDFGGFRGRGDVSVGNRACA